MKIKLLIPKHNAQHVFEQESWTVSWSVRTGWFGDVKTYHKVFTDKKDALVFEKELRESAKFIRAYINTDIVKN